MDNVQPRTTRAKVVYSLMRNMPRFFVLALMVLIVILAILMNGEKKRLAHEKETASPPEQPPVNVVVLPLRPTPIRDLITLPGMMEAWEDLNLLARISGTVAEVPVKEGESVTRGTLLALLEDEDYRIAHDRAKAASDFAQAEYDRAVTMFKKKVISPAELDSRKTRLQTAKADLAASTLQLSRCEIRSPLAGVVKTLFAKPGLFVGVGDPLAEILQINKLKAVVGIPESDVDAVSRIDEFNITIKALGDLQVIGRKKYLAPAPEDRARLYRLELAVDNSGGKILQGMFIRAEIVRQQVADGIVVPLYAVISEKDRHFVYTEVDGTSRKQEVELGFLEGWKVLVTSGLKSGDKVLVEGQRSVEDGRRIHVVRELADVDEIQP